MAGGSDGQQNNIIRQLEYMPAADNTNRRGGRAGGDPLKVQVHACGITGRGDDRRADHTDRPDGAET